MSKFIVIEGIDGSGKSTVAKMLGKILVDNGYNVWNTAEPTDGSIGQLIRQNLREVNSNPTVDALLFAADRIIHTCEVLEKMCSDIVVISDRYLLSSLVYQSCQGLDVEWIEQINKAAVKPSVEIILKCSPVVAYGRLCETGKNKEKFETLEWLEKMSFGYNMFSDESQIVVNAEMPIDKILDEILSKLLKRFNWDDFRCRRFTS